MSDPLRLPDAVPDFIPDGVQSAYLDEARVTVAAAHAGPVGETDLARGGVRIAVIATAVALAVLGSFGLSLLWTWLVLTDGSVWLPFAIGGWAATVAIPGVLAGLWWHGRPA